VLGVWHVCFYARRPTPYTPITKGGIVATTTVAKTQESTTDEQIAAQFGGSIIYKAMLEAGEPSAAKDLARIAARPDIDTKLARVIVATNPNMTAVDRKWTLWTRYLDVRRTLDYNLQRILNTFGQPIPLPQLARELETIYGRPAVIYEEMLERLASDPARFFRVGVDGIAPTSWLLDTDAAIEEEVLFDNFLDDDDVFPLLEIAEELKLSADRPEAIAEFLDRADRPVKNRAVQFLAWRGNKEAFDAAAFYRAVYDTPGVYAIGEGRWIGPNYAARLVEHFAALSEIEVSDTVEATAQETAQPLNIGQPERDALVKIILENEDVTRASTLLEELFEVTPDYRTYAEDMRSIHDALSHDDRVIWLGSDRYRPQGSVPTYVYSVPGLLEISETSYLDVEGLPIDILLEDEGFDGGLERDILNPLAQDVLDEERVAAPDPNPPSNARAVIKYHHKQIGTLPLCQFASGFFPATPNILETEFILPGGQKAQVWVNNETRLLYGLLDWFDSIPIDSGATFTLERQEVDRYAINYNDESEPAMFISRNRVNELLLIQERTETEELANFDLVREIMEHYRKGIEFLTLHTEVNIVRRVTRRMVASILSEYHCFFQRSGAWVYDAKKLSQGFDKSKRKYIAK